MNAIAKIFQRDGEQVLIFKDNDNAGNPAVKVHMSVKGLWITQAISGKPEDFQDRAFDAIDEEKAFGFLADTIQMLDDLEDDEP